MIQFPLSHLDTLIIENIDHQIRLIIIENEKEAACRKEKLRKLE
jgi:hypothetical protein